MNTWREAEGEGEGEGRGEGGGGEGLSGQGLQLAWQMTLQVLGEANTQQCSTTLTDITAE